MRIATHNELASALARFSALNSQLATYKADMVDHPIAGRSLQHYILLTDFPELVSQLGLTTAERFWSRYYWLSRFAREWQQNCGSDAGLDQQLFQLLESAEGMSVSLDPLPDVEAAVERDAVKRAMEDKC